MRKFILLIASVITMCGTASAVSLEIFNHLGLGVGVGTPGISIEAGTTLTPWVQLRAGVDIMPKIKVNTDLDLKEYDVEKYMEEYDIPGRTNIDVQGKLTNTTGHVLFDVFPATHLSSFHITVGAYFGGSKIVSAYNTSQQDILRDIYLFNSRMGEYSDIPASAGRIGAELGDYFIEPDSKGELNASVRVNSFRPYVGLGFGRIVPKKRINCLFDLGVQFWGSPKVWNDTQDMELTAAGAKGKDGGVIRTISKISVYPVLSIKLVGRLF